MNMTVLLNIGANIYLIRVIPNKTYILEDFS